MKIAFDARSWSSPPHSFRRVLQILFDSAQAMGWDVELWMDDELQPDLERYRKWVRRMDASGAIGGADVFWSPSVEIPEASIPSVGTIHDINPLLPDNRPWLVRLWRGAKFRYRVKKAFGQASRMATDSEYSRCRISVEFPSDAGVCDAAAGAAQGPPSRVRGAGASRPG